LFLSRV